MVSRLPPSLVRSFAWSLAILLAIPSVAALEAEPAAGVLLSEPVLGVEMGVDLERAPDGSLYVAELWTGKLRVVRPNASRADDEPVWTAPGVQDGGERGFAGLALAHDFETSRAFYVFYTHNESGEITNRISRVEDGNETPILWGLKASIQHNGGRLLPLPDGTLLVALGDTTINAPDRMVARHAHDPEVLQGKVLRIRPDGSVPADNPFGTLVWTKGHRNIYGLALAPDGTVLATENGQQENDEMNVLVAGRDYGWPTCAGRCDDASFAQPVMTFTPTIAPTGAAWHDGAFYFADFNEGRIHRLRELPDGTWTNETALTFPTAPILDIEEAPGGLDVLTWEGIFHVRLDERWSLAPGAAESDGSPTLAPTNLSPSPAPEEVALGDRVPGVGAAVLVLLAGLLASARARVR